MFRHPRQKQWSSRTPQLEFLHQNELQKTLLMAKWHIYTSSRVRDQSILKSHLGHLVAIRLGKLLPLNLDFQVVKMAIIIVPITSHSLVIKTQLETHARRLTACGPKPAPRHLTPYASLNLRSPESVSPLTSASYDKTALLFPSR